MAGLLTLTTDFGLGDPYVGMVKGVVLSRTVDARIVDLTHDVAPQNVAQGAFLLEVSRHFFPPGSVHMVVVDPGVGTIRRRLAVGAGGQYFVGPDNGCLSSALAAGARPMRPAGSPYETAEVAVPADILVFSIEAFDLLGIAEPSATFEGRDVFAPAAAYLAGGGVLEALGPRLRTMQAFPAWRALPDAEGGLQGVVLHVDHFGNLITDIAAADLPGRPEFEVNGHSLTSRSRTYAEASGLTAIAGSSGYVEIALPNGNASRALGAAIGDSVRLRPSRV